MPEHQNKPVMRGQHLAKPVPVLGTPAHRQHQHGDDGGGKPAEAEQADLGSYQLLQHCLSGSSGGIRPVGSRWVMAEVIVDQAASVVRTGGHVVLT